MMVNFNGRQSRKIKLGKIIEDNFKEGDWFTVHDIQYLWMQRWRHVPAVRELAKIIPSFGFESESRDGFAFKFYKYDGRKPVYVKEERDF